MRFHLKTKHLFFCLFLSGLTVGMAAQTKKDSLWRAWQNAELPDTQRLKAIQALTWPMMNVNLDSAFLLANAQLDFAREKQNQRWTAKAYYNIGTYYYYKGDFVKSLSAYQQSLDLRKAIGDLKGEAAIYGNIGLIYGQQGNYLKDLQYQLKALAINEKIRDTANITANYNNLANIYQEQGDSAKALEYYNLAIRMHEAQHAEDALALLYNNIGNLYRKFREFDKALAYLQKSLTVRTRLKDRLGMAINYVNLATVYNKMGDFEKARENNLKSIELFKALRDTSSLANAYFTMGETSVKEKRYADAIHWCSQSHAIAEASHKLPIQQAACFCLYDAYKNTGQTAKSLDYLERYVSLSDSVSQQELKVEMNRLQFEKELVIDSLSREEEKTSMEMSHQRELNRKTRTTYIIVFLGLGVLLLALVFMGRSFYFQRNAETLQRKAQELEKQQLLSEISLLRNQVNPHFLFNSLSILASLVRVDPDLSEKFIDQLSRSYRYILEQKDQSLVTLRTELGFIESYAFLLKIRFENKFNLLIDLPDAVLDKFKIAPLTLQLLVENAVKHNRMSVSEPLVVTVSLGEENVLLVKNKLQPRSTEYASTGVGLQNITDRYALLTSRPVWVGESDGFFLIKVPLLLCEQKFRDDS